MKKDLIELCKVIGVFQVLLAVSSLLTLLSDPAFIFQAYGFLTAVLAVTVYAPMLFAVLIGNATSKI